jgi:hypothetical protein
MVPPLAVALPDTAFAPLPDAVFFADTAGVLEELLEKFPAAARAANGVAMIVTHTATTMIVI